MLKAPSIVKQYCEISQKVAVGFEMRQETSRALALKQK